MNFEHCGTFGNIFYFLFVPKGPAKNAQVVMIRSITEDWFFPFFVDWDMAIGVEEFNKLICKAYEEEFTVVVSTCDQSGKNEGLRNKLKITPKQKVFKYGGNLSINMLLSFVLLYLLSLMKIQNTVLSFKGLMNHKKHEVYKRTKL